MTKVRNISTGPRGVYLKGALTMIDPGKTGETDEDFAEEWFEEVSEGDTDLSKMTVAQLKAFAAASDIDLAGAAKKEDILAAIELALEETQG